MTKKEYAEYQAAVAAFFEKEGIENLSSGHIRCPDCQEDFSDDGPCPDCGKSVEDFPDEPFFSWRPCECCGRPLDGDRYHATGYNRTEDAIQEYDVCTDCIYYAEYGQLDDTTMEEIKKDGGQ